MDFCFIELIFMSYLLMHEITEFSSLFETLGTRGCNLLSLNETSIICFNLINTAYLVCGEWESVSTPALQGAPWWLNPVCCISTIHNHRLSSWAECWPTSVLYPYLNQLLCKEVLTAACLLLLQLWRLQLVGGRWRCAASCWSRGRRCSRWTGGGCPPCSVRSDRDTGRYEPWTELYVLMNWT